MSFNIDAANQIAANLNASLEPRANRPVDITDTRWLQKTLSAQHPLDEANVRPAAEALLDSLLDAYATGDEQQRSSIRGLFAKHRAFTWATRVSEPATTERGFRKHLLRLSAENGAQDIRDTIVEVNALCAIAKKAGLNVGLVLEEVAALSSSEVVHRMTSVQRILRNAR